MPRTPKDSADSTASPQGRRLLQTWLQQKLQSQENICFLPAASAAGSSPTGRAAARVSASPVTQRKSAAEKAAAAGNAPEHSLFAAASTVQAPDDDSMQRIAAEVNACTRCRLHETRDKAVPGVGPDDSDLVFIGEGPGADEDRQGEPFVGRAGQLLTRILAAVELGRDEVFITNIVKCRPPNNRDPRPDEIEACEPYLKRQLRVLDPKVICTLGRHAAMTLLQTKESMAKLRTGERQYEGVRLFPTYHPAALLRNPQWKRPVWEDIQKVRKAYDEPREKN